MHNIKLNRLMKDVEEHLRNTSRQLIQFDTEEEALQYLTNYFHAAVNFDFVGVALIEADALICKAWSGKLDSIAAAFPIPVGRCTPKLLAQNLTSQKDGDENCLLISKLKEMGAKTWFTVPLAEKNRPFGFCIFGYDHYVPLLDLEQSFEEFGKDIAVILKMVKKKEMQSKRIKGMEWISQSLSLEKPFENYIADLTAKAGLWTKADFACIYAYNEKENSFVFQPPAYGKMDHPKIIPMDNYRLKDTFPYLEEPGSSQLTIPLVVNVKTVGVLHIEKKHAGRFTEEDLAVLDFLSQYIAALLENARLYNNEKERKNRLLSLLDYEQKLIKETVKNESFDAILSAFAEIFKSSVVLFDQFMQPIAIQTISPEKPVNVTALAQEAKKLKKSFKDGFTVQNPDESVFSFWRISAENRLLGFLAIGRNPDGFDEFDRLTVDLFKNICSIQFMKQRLVLEAKEQEKDSFVSQILTGKIKNKKSVLQYANFLQWDLFKSHRVAVLSIAPDGQKEDQTAQIWDFIKSKLLEWDKDILTASVEGMFIVIAPATREKGHDWPALHEKMEHWAADEWKNCALFMGIGSETADLEDYQESFKQALQAHKVVKARLRKEKFAFFEALGSYTILHHLNNPTAIDLFLRKQLGPLIEYSDSKSMNLCHTLDVYLKNNGNVNSTSKELFMHRSSLLYRLERIESLLNIRLNDSETRFNLMMALKLYEMYGYRKKRLPDEDA